MKILCLHGGGLNADLMERQMAGIIDALDASYEFVFVDGEIERPPAPGVPAGVQGPFYSYYDGLGADSIRDACDLIEMILEEEGPFDGFIGFSQGASVGVSYILDRKMGNPDMPCPFLWMLLFSCTVALSPDPDMYELEFALRDELRAKDRAEDVINAEDIGHDDEQHRIDTAIRMSRIVRSTETRELFLRDRAVREALSEDYYALSKAFAVSAENEGREGVMSLYGKQLEKRSTADAPRFYHPGMISQRIPIPSIHCVGRNDKAESFQQSMMIRELCEEDEAMYIEHASGHAIPRDTATIQAVAKALKGVIEESRWKAQRPIC